MENLGNSSVVIRNRKLMPTLLTKTLYLTNHCTEKKKPIPRYISSKRAKNATFVCSAFQSEIGNGKT